MENKTPTDEIIEGQKAMLKAIGETCSGKSAEFFIGAVIVLEKQAELLKNHILECLPDKKLHAFGMILSAALYDVGCKTDIVSYKIEKEATE